MYLLGLLTSAERGARLEAAQSHRLEMVAASLPDGVARAATPEPDALEVSYLRHASDAQF